MASGYDFQEDVIQAGGFNFVEIEIGKDFKKLEAFFCP